MTPQTAQPLLVYYAVRSKLLIIGVCAPIASLMLVLLAAWLAADYLDGRIGHAESLKHQQDDVRGSLTAEKALLRSMKSDHARLQVIPAAVARRISQLVTETHVESENLTEKIAKSALFLTRPMTVDSSGIKLTVKGTPEAVHNFFFVLESEFPSLAVQNSTISVDKDLMKVDSLYLLPAYDTPSLAK